MANLMSKFRSLAGAALVAVLSSVPYPASAKTELLSGYRVGGEASYKIGGYSRLEGYAQLSGEVDLFSYDDFKLSIGSNMRTYFRRVDKTTLVQPDVIDYDLWPMFSLKNEYGEFSLSYLHQCTHNIDEKDLKLVEDSRSHNIIPFMFENRYDTLEGLEVKAGLGPVLMATQSGYKMYFNTDIQLSLTKLTEDIVLYARTRQTQLIFENDSHFGVEWDMENEIGLELRRNFRAQIFVKHQRIDGYLMFMDKPKDMSLIGIRFR